MVHAFVANSGHMPLLLNSLKSIHRLPTPWKSLVFALDTKICSDLRQLSSKIDISCIPYAPRMLQQMKQDEPIFYQECINKTGQEISLHESASWGSDMHKVLINSKLYALRDSLNCGLDVFLTDVDVAFLKDPRPYFDGGEDIIAQNDTNPVNYKLNINSGFMYWRHTQQNLNLSQALVKETVWSYFDQTRVNELLWERRVNATILNTTQFPNGFSLWGLTTLNDTIAVHVNWNENLDQKIQRLMKHDLWLID